MQTGNQATSDLLGSLIGSQPEAAALLRQSEQEQEGAGHYHTFREICQQPETWLDTASRMIRHAPRIAELLGGVQSLVLTGSGSSEYAGECVQLGLQRSLGVDCRTIAGGAILTSGGSALPKGRPCLMVSLARSGDSPESAGAVDLVMKSQPDIRHLVLTCNESGRLATAHKGNPRVEAVVLDSRTNDRSLVMTSSFSNLSLGATFLGFADDLAGYRDHSVGLSGLCGSLIAGHIGTLARVGRGPFRRVVFLGSGERFGAARESALKVMEMTAGRVTTMAETYLGVRHGPMSYIHADTLVVCFLSSDPLLRSYEADLIAELSQKGLGAAKLLFGEGIPSDLVQPGDTVIEIAGLAALGDDNTAIVHVVGGQLLAFFRCLAEGLKPDSPSEDGVIQRVVNNFTIHHQAGRVNG